MKITSDETTSKHTRRIAIEGVAAQPVAGYSFKGKEYLPVSIHLSWANDDEPDRVTVSGPVLKKDGTPGRQYADCDYTLTGRAWDSRPDAPDWLRRILSA